MFPCSRWLLATLLPLAACTTAPSPPVSAIGRISPADSAFLTQAAQDDGFVAQSSRLALQKARRPAVRAYARQMIDAHDAAVQTLTAVAGRKGVALPDALDPARQRTLADLQSDGTSFDAAYVAAQTAVHRSAIAAFQSEAAGGADADVRSFAEATLPELRTHLATAERLRGAR